MCVIYLAFRTDPRFRLAVAANRDEFHDRPTVAMHPWAGSQLLAGRDLRSGGTWLGLHRGGRFAALTNFRETSTPEPGGPSRGSLVKEFLESELSPLAWASGVVARAGTWAGFSLLLSDLDTLVHVSNRGDGAMELSPGLYAISNGRLGDPWPKVLKGSDAFRQVLERGERIEPTMAGLFEILADAQPALDGELPATGVGIDRERELSPIFIRGPLYGTRSSSVILIEDDGTTVFVERSFGPEGEPGGARRADLTVDGRQEIFVEG